VQGSVLDLGAAIGRLKVAIPVSRLSTKAVDLKTNSVIMADATSGTASSTYDAAATWREVP
jgi:2-polyprenyl-3-methyl-5-hydroxy-6-metoxy-1,4-benzoquinol methylase